MSLQRRLFWVVLLSAALVWSVAAWVSADRARHEIDELFDTEIIRLARKVQSVTGDVIDTAPSEAQNGHARGEADLSDLAVAVWNAEGQHHALGMIAGHGRFRHRGLAGRV